MINLMSATQEEIGQLIRNLRKQRKMTQSELGEKIGLKKSAVALCENGKRNFTTSTLQRFAEALNAELIVDLKLK